jgi:hypothetical protein
MAKSFSSRYVDYLLEKVCACRPAAADYILHIDEQHLAKHRLELLKAAAPSSVWNSNIKPKEMC